MTELDRLLMRIRDGDASPATLERARALLAEDVRLPQDLREIGLDDDEPAIAATALLGVLGLDGGLFGELLGEALEFEAGVAPPEPVEAPITAADLAAQEADLPPIADAIAALAGDIDIDIAVLRALGVPVIEVAPAVRGAAGEADLADAVTARLGLVPTPVAPAVRAEAGEIDISAEVVRPLGDPLWPIAAAVRAGAGQVEVAPNVLVELGVVTIPIAAAVSATAGEIDLAPAVLEQLGAAPIPIAAAVRAESGSVDILATLGAAFAEGWVAGLLDRELPAAAHRLAAARLMRQPEVAAELTAFADLGRAVRAGVADEAGETPYIWAAVAAELGVGDPEHVGGYEDGVVAEAIRESAGPVQVAPQVMSRIERPSAVPELDEALPEPANTAPWRWAGLALAAAALLVVVVGRVAPFEGIVPDGDEPAAALAPDFASADEVQVEQLDYDEGVNVTVQLPDDEGDRPLIIWVNEEA